MSQITKQSTGGGGGSGIMTIDGDVGSITGSIVAISTGQAANNSGATFEFKNNSGTSSLLNVTDGQGNTFVGKQTGVSGIIGTSTGFGSNNLNSLTSGQGSAFGSQTLSSLQDGTDNCAFGNGALTTSTSDSQNCAFGNISLTSLNGAGGGTSNSAFGYQSLFSLQTGNFNCAFGAMAGTSYFGSESFNICIGSPGVTGENNALHIGDGVSSSPLQQSFIGGIRGVVVTGSPILISGSDQLGVAASSIKFKKNVTDMADTTAQLMSLRPVNFNWNESGPTDSPTDMQYGLIAEEVDKTFPYLCVYDKQGKPFSVKYHELPALLLNEIQKLRKEVDQLKGVTS